MLQTKHPSALDAFGQMMSAAKGKDIVVFLDYDGTLSRIVQDPDKAFMTAKVIYHIIEISPIKQRTDNEFWSSNNSY